jgi:hypothetical protein
MTFRFVCLLQRVHWRSGVNAIKLVFFVQTNKLGLLSCTALTALPEVWNLSQSVTRVSSQHSELYYKMQQSVPNAKCHIQALFAVSWHHCKGRLLIPAEDLSAKAQQRQTPKFICSDCEWQRKKRFYNFAGRRHVPKFVTQKLGGASLGDAVAPMPGVVEKVWKSLILFWTSLACLRIGRNKSKTYRHYEKMRYSWAGGFKVAIVKNANFKN